MNSSFQEALKAVVESETLPEPSDLWRNALLRRCREVRREGSSWDIAAAVYPRFVLAAALTACLVMGIQRSGALATEDELDVLFQDDEVLTYQIEELL